MVAIYCLDLEEVNAEGEPPVVIYTPGAPPAHQFGETVAQDFGSFLLQRIERQESRHLKEA